MNKVIGKLINCVDGKFKVIGSVCYIVDILIENLIYGVLIESIIVKGKIIKLEIIIVEIVFGVLVVIIYCNVFKFN